MLSELSEFTFSHWLGMSDTRELEGADTVDKSWGFEWQDQKGSGRMSGALHYPSASSQTWFSWV